MRGLSFKKIFYYVPLEVSNSLFTSCFYPFTSSLLDFFRLGSSHLTRDHNSWENILSPYNTFLYNPVSTYYKIIVFKFTPLLVGWFAHIFSK